MNATFPFLSAYDPAGTSEGTLDPLGLYQIADQLAVRLVPAVRERMQRIRFLTAMAVGAFVIEGLDDDPSQRDASPYLIWEWLLIEAMIRAMAEDPSVRGVPGTLVARRAIDQYGYLDARSYLKTPRIFGFHGVYKRLAAHLGIVDVHLGPGPNAERLMDAWARDQGLGGFAGAKSRVLHWRAAVCRSLGEKPPHTNRWSKESWEELARAFAPAGAKVREKRYLRELLLAADERRLGALPLIWELQKDFADETYQEESLHNRLEERNPAYGPLLQAIRKYEKFARSLQDAFDVLKAQAAAERTSLGFAIPEIASNKYFKLSVKRLDASFEEAHRALGEVTITSVSLQNLFSERFGVFSEPMDAGQCALALCSHHETVQRAKSAEGKRAWFDRMGRDRIYIRHAYREPPRNIQPDQYVHDYRGRPIRRFYFDLS